MNNISHKPNTFWLFKHDLIGWWCPLQPLDTQIYQQSRWMKTRRSEWEQMAKCWPHSWLLCWVINSCNFVNFYWCKIGDIFHALKSMAESGSVDTFHAILSMYSCFVIKSESYIWVLLLQCITTEEVKVIFILLPCTVTMWEKVILKWHFPMYF